MDSKDLDRRIRDLDQLAAATRASGRGWPEVWGAIKEIRDGFRDVRFPSQAERQARWERFQSIVDDVHETQRTQGEKAEANRTLAASRIKALTRVVEDAVDRRAPWKAAWAEFAVVRAELKALDLGRKAERDELWARVNALNDRARKEFESQADESGRCRNEVTTLAESARPIGAAAQAIIDGFFGAFTSTIVDAATLGAFRQEVDERKEYLKGCSQTLKEAWGRFGEYKAVLFGRDKHVAYETLQSVQQALDAEWAEWKGMNETMRERQHEAYVERQRVREERTERRRENLAKNRERLERLEQALSKQEAHLDELREKRDTAWNDDFRERVEGWIEEAEASIEELREKIANVERWIEEDEEKL